MTDKAFPRPKFDPEQTFVVNKPIMLSGKTYVPGSIFDSTLVSSRQLRQFYDQRYLRPSDKEHPRLARVSRIRKVYPTEMSSSGEHHGTGENQPSKS